jgi:cytochrome c-type biogenesis protein CcmE
MRFGLGILIILGAITYFAFAGFDEGKAYYKTLDELEEMGPHATGKRLRVAGLVKTGSIEREGTGVRFELEYEGHTLPVHYVGSQPIPDTFKDGVDAVVEGQRLENGTFEADHLQAKCASKYEAETSTTEESNGY